jgi:hypothetical protein
MARTPALQEDEAPPEADRLEGFLHPRETSTLIGHEAAELELAQAFAGGRIHHAWLIAGPEGIGKATLAYRLARHVLDGRRSAIPQGKAWKLRRRPPPHGRSARCPIRACWCCAGPTTCARSGLRRAFPWTRFAGSSRFWG